MSNFRFEKAVLETNAVALMHAISGLSDLELVNFEEWTFLRVGEGIDDDERMRLKRCNQVAVCEIVRRFKMQAMNGDGPASSPGPDGVLVHPMSMLRPKPEC